MRRVLGTASYMAVRWPHDFAAVALTAAGVLPCRNHIARLERRPGPSKAPAWDMVFVVDDRCAPGVAPFQVAARAGASFGATRVLVHQVGGPVEVPILDPVIAPHSFPPHARTHHFVVEATPPGLEASPPAEPSIGMHTEHDTRERTYRRVFGPASRVDCEAWLAVYRTAADGPDGLYVQEVPWPIFAES